MANEGTLKKFIADLSAELKERQTITASQPARNDCPVCITLKLSDPCPHLSQSGTGAQTEPRGADII